MEVLIEKKEGIEDKNERCKQMGLRFVKYYKRDVIYHIVYARVDAEEEA